MGRDFPNIMAALRGALRLAATIAAFAALLAFLNRLVGIAYPGVL